MNKIPNNLTNINFFLILVLPFALLFGTFISEIIIFLSTVFFLIKSYIEKEWEWTAKTEFKFLLLIWGYLILNAILANNIHLSLSRGIFFFRFILLIFVISDILKNKRFENIIFISWISLTIVTSVDIYIEFFFQKNLLENFSEYPGRIASFTGKELKIGGYLIAILLTSFSFFLNKNLNIKKYIILLSVLTLALIAVIITGERSNSIKAVFIFVLFLLFLKKHQLIKYIVLILFIIILIMSVLNINKIKYRYTEIINNISNPIILLKDSLHGAHYSTAWKIFKNYPYFGVGNKNFREECQNKIYLDKNYKYTENRCSTHPHQIYLELLSELGIIGTLLIVFFIIFISAKSFLIYFKNYNLLILAPTLYIISIFIPLIPSGSFFTSFGATLFWLNIGIILSNFNKN
jgi:O-antigen ligase